MRGNLLKRWLVLVFCVWGAAVLPAEEQVIYVDTAAGGANDGSSWTDAYHSLQDALAAAAAAPKPLEIRVAQGTYKPDQRADLTPGDKEASFRLLNGVTLKGGYVGSIDPNPGIRDMARRPTVLSGQLNEAAIPGGRYNSHYVVTGSSTDPSAILDGFTITHASVAGMRLDGGNPFLMNCTFERNRGDGVESHSGSPSVSHCKFINNVSCGFRAKDCNSVLIDCLFLRNGQSEHFGGGIDSGPSLTLRDCAFQENMGSAINLNGTLSLLRCSFVANSGFRAGGLNVSGTLMAQRCSFVTNTSSGWGGAITCGNLILRECEFVGNSGDGTGAIANPSLPLWFSNCTFVGNRGWPNTINEPPRTDDPARLTQCIVWDGPNPFSRNPSEPATIIVTYSDVQGGYAGEGNFDADPCFVALGYWDTNGTPDDLTDDVWIPGDCHLKSQAGDWDRETETWVLDDVTSPYMDAGDPNGFLGAGPFPNGGYFNLGAYGGAREASRSYFGGPVCQNQLAGDINGDCKVDQADLDILLSHWLADAADMGDAGTLNLPE